MNVISPEHSTSNALLMTFFMKSLVRSFYNANKFSRISLLFNYRDGK